MARVRVVVLHGPGSSRARLRDLVAAVPAADLVGWVEAGDDAAERVEELRPDVVVATQGTAGLDELGRRLPAVALVLIEPRLVSEPQAAGTG
jgi:chemotaxis response regulator CheB